MTHAETVKKGNQLVEEGKKAKPDGGPPACSLMTRAEVQKATGRTLYADPTETPIAGGTACHVGQSQLTVLTGPDSWQRYERLLAGFKQDKQPRTSVSGVGDRGYLMTAAPRNSYQRDNPTAVLVVQRGRYTLALSSEAGPGKTAESAHPALMSLMKAVLGKLP